ncbi:DBF4 homolog B [Pelobates cultripes]|uniref:DBF4 homolog B n=1 Tax=Pelobates cultripes TaxID=61616 RepID=A0AAD1WFY3_PELCU|nr:DBF4 homolog B [Pelobates cultripes]
MADPNSIQTGQKEHMEQWLPLDMKRNFNGCSFSGKSFYLDLLPNKQTDILTKAIVQLGGVIESFLSRDITYVVTGNKKLSGYARKDSAATKGTSNSRCQTSGGIESAQYSRGKQLLKKAMQSQERNNVLTNACSWGVSIVHVDEILEYIECLGRHSTNGINTKANKGKGNGCTKPSHKVAKLKSPFLKIEDHSRLYRPIHSTFSSFPEISFVSSDRSPFQTAQTRNSTRPGRDPGEQEEGERVLQAQRRRGYCECCEKMFSKLDEHLAGEQHCKFALNPSHYTVIENLVAKLSFDFMELPRGVVPSMDCRSEQGELEWPSLDTEQTMKEVTTLEPVREINVSKAAVEDICPEVAPIDQPVYEKLEEAAVLNWNVMELVNVELEANSTKFAELFTQTMDGASVEFQDHNMVVQAERTEDNIESKLHIPCSNENLEDSKLPLTFLDLQPPVLSFPLGNTIAPSFVRMLLEDHAAVHKPPRIDPAVDSKTDLTKEPLLSVMGNSHTYLDNAWALTKIGFPTWYQNQVEHPFTSICKPFDPLILSPLPCGSWLLPLTTTSQPASNETVKSTETSQDVEPLVARTYCRKTKRKFCGSPYPPPAKRQSYTCQPAYTQTVAIPMFMGLWNGGDQIPIPVWADWTKWDSNELTGGSSTHSFPCFQPKLDADNVSSELDWDVLLPSRQNPPQQNQHYGHLRTVQVDLNQSWYGKQLCSVLADN